MRYKSLSKEEFLKQLKIRIILDKIVELKHSEISREINERGK